MKVRLPTRKGVATWGWHASIGDLLIEYGPEYDHVDAMANAHGGVILTLGTDFKFAFGAIVGSSVGIYFGFGHVVLSCGWGGEMEEIFAEATP